VRIESSVTSVSWIPREAIEGMVKLPFELGVAHYDLPPPDHLDDLESLLDSSAVRFANELRAFIEADDEGRITGHGHLGRGHMGHTRMRLAGIGLTFAGIAFPDLRGETEVGDGVVRFTQTAGGQPGMPSPRRVRRRPYLQVSGPVVWSTLALELRADGTASFEVVGASSFPRHWIYGHDGTLQAKTGLIDFDTWYRESFGENNLTHGGDRGKQGKPRTTLVVCRRTLSPRASRAPIAWKGPAYGSRLPLPRLNQASSSERR
jgi:hypothetical protein